MFSQVQGQPHAIQQLQSAIQNQRLPHTYLFVGPSHIGKHTTALALAQVLNCEQRTASNDACGLCPSCQQCQSQHSPMITTLTPDGQEIKIAQIQEAIGQIQWKPEKHQYRVLIIDPAESMNTYAANAFLKTLEEPPPQTLMILLASSEKQLLETIVSRAQTVVFQPLSNDIIQNLLQQQTTLSPEDQQFLQLFSHGQLRTEWIEQLEPLKSLHQEVLQTLQMLANHDLLTALEHSQTWVATKDDSWKQALLFLEYTFSDLAKALATSKLQSNQPAYYDQALRTLGSKYTIEQALNAYDVVTTTQSRIKGNANKALAMDGLWLELQNLRKAA